MVHSSFLEIWAGPVIGFARNHPLSTSGASGRKFFLDELKSNYFNAIRHKNLRRKTYVSHCVQAECEIAFGLHSPECKV